MIWGVVIALCVVFIPLFVFNCVLVVKGFTVVDRPASAFGLMPLIINSDIDDSVLDINNNDLTFFVSIDAEKLQVDEIIAYMKSDKVRINKIKKIETVNNVLTFTVFGDNMEPGQEIVVSADKVLGKYSFKMAGFGAFALFLQTPAGIACFVAVPLFAYFIYDLVKRTRQEKAEKEEKKRLEEELNKLKAVDKIEEIQSKIEENQAKIEQNQKLIIKTEEKLKKTIIPNEIDKDRENDILEPKKEKQTTKEKKPKTSAKEKKV